MNNIMICIYDRLKLSNDIFRIMIKAPVKEKTVKKLFNIPDDLVVRMDTLANGYYPTRSDFLSHATISFIRNRMNWNRINLITLQEKYRDAELVDRIFEASESGLRELKKDLLPKYTSRTVTPITLYFTEKQLEVIMICFISDYGELRNLQEFVRLAAAYYVWELEQELAVFDLIDPERFKGIYEIDHTA